jgi:hypothetical protein
MHWQRKLLPRLGRSRHGTLGKYALLLKFRRTATARAPIELRRRSSDRDEFRFDAKRRLD